MNKLLAVVTVLVIASCGTNRVFEEHQDFKEPYWVQSNSVDFGFTIDDPAIPYDIYTYFRNSSAYPYHNLYYQYTLTDSTGNLIKQELKNINLFDPKSGQPNGSGLGDLFDNEQLIIEGITFQKSGLYNLKLEQYMRRDTLPLLISVGARVEWSEAE